MAPIHPIARGRAGEFLVAFDFANRGYSCIINTDASSPYDILVDNGKGKLLKVQVKATAGPRENRRGRGYRIYKFQITGKQQKRYSHIDLFALVAIDIKAIVYCLPSEMPRTYSTTLSLGVNRFLRMAAEGLRF